MWGLIRSLVGLGAPARRKLDEGLSRGRERGRWVIYGAIVLGVVMLAVVGIMLLVVP